MKPPHSPCCSKCKSPHCVKSGIVNGKQRYKCKQCNYFFRQGDKRKDKAIPSSIVRFAIILYLEGNGFRKVERILKSQGFQVSHVSVIKWVKMLGEGIKQLRKESVSDAKVEIMELDEMWHFTKKNKTNCGYGLHMIETKEKLLISLWEAEAMKRGLDFSIK